MSTQNTAIESQEGSHNMMQWILAIIEKVNDTSRLAPNRAIQKRLREVTDTYGSARLWEAIKQYSTALGVTNALFMEELFHKCPELPDLFEIDKALPEALNQWFEQNSENVTQFHKVSSAMLRANPVIEWKAEPLSDANGDFTPIMDMLFRNNTEGG